MDEINNECTILVPKTRKTMAAQGGNPNKSVTFSFDRCYNTKTTTAQIYDEIPYSLVQVCIGTQSSPNNALRPKLEEKVCLRGLPRPVGLASPFPNVVTLTTTTKD